jgi:hypothetical protein
MIVADLGYVAEAARPRASGWTRREFDVLIATACRIVDARHVVLIFPLRKAVILAAVLIEVCTQIVQIRGHLGTADLAIPVLVELGEVR